MTATTTPQVQKPAVNGQTVKPTIDPSKLPGVIAKMRDVQTEGDRWELAESLAAMIPSGAGGFGNIIDAATKEGVAGNLSANTLRLYRDTANRWPSSDRVKNVSFSAHREAMVLPTVEQAVRMLNDLSKTLGSPGKVTVASVRKAVAIKQGKQPTAKQAAGHQPAAKQVDLLRDLESNNGAEVIKAIGNESVVDKLDRLHASLSKVIAHVEKLRAKQARANAKAKPAPKAAAHPAVAKPAAQAKKAGDIRGL